jgi:histidyl-tRNA synthetase
MKESTPLKEKYRSPKGFQDIVPPESFTWKFIDDTAQKVCSNYGYHEMRIPVVEHTEIFARSIGETTDIVEKEMYTFTDRAGRSLTLRPEGTASVVRSYVQNGLYMRPAPQKYFYRGPMFRYERPQKGRFRQFYQIGAEAFGVEEPGIDAEMLSLLRDFFSAIGLSGLDFEINSVGCRECRPVFREALRNFLSGKISRFCADCRRRYDTNPLRILDCKVPGCIEETSGAPEIADYLCDTCRQHFSEFRQYLETLGIECTVNPRLVRGLDYYTSTTFEITTTLLGSQKAVAAGGRYNMLVEEFGGPSTPAVGFAVGVERIADLLSRMKVVEEPRPDLFIANMTREARRIALNIAQRVRTHDFWCEVNFSEASLRNLLKKADKMGARYAFIIGDDELGTGHIKYRRLSDGSEGLVNSEDYEGMINLISSSYGEHDGGI